MITSFYEQCNTVLSTLGRNEQCDAAAALFQDMTANGPPPDKVTNQTMVFVFERVYRYKEAGIFRSILNMAPAIVRVRTGKGQVVQSSTTEKTTSTSIPNIKNKVSINNDDEIPAAQMSTFNGEDNITPDSTASTVNINNLDGHTYVQNDPTPLEDYYPDSIRLSPAGTLKDKLLADGRRVGKNKKEEFPLKGVETIVSTARTDNESSTNNDISEKIKKVSSKKGSVDTNKGSDDDEVEVGVVELTSEIKKIKTTVKLTGTSKEKEKGKNKEKIKIKEKKDVAVIEVEVEEKMEEKIEEIKWEKGGGGAAAVIRLLGIAGKSAEAEEIFLSLEKEGERGGVSLPTALYNAASKCSLISYYECHIIFLHEN